MYRMKENFEKISTEIESIIKNMLKEENNNPDTYISILRYILSTGIFKIKFNIESKKELRLRLLEFKDKNEFFNFPSNFLETSYTDILLKNIFNDLSIENVELLGMIYETYYYKYPVIKHDTIELVDLMDRKGNGVYYTDPKIVNFMTEKIINENKNINSLRIVDPSVGTGYFILSLYKKIKKTYNLNDFETLEGLYGVDKDPNSISITKLLIWSLMSSNDFVALDNNFKQGDSLLYNNSSLIDNDRYFNWKNIFMDIFDSNKGFDIVIGNPPWGKIKVHNNDRFKFHNQHEYENHKKEVLSYRKELNSDNLYLHQKSKINGKTTGGDSDLYKYFLELAQIITNEQGKIYFIIPTSFFSSEGTTSLRKFYFSNGSFNKIYNFINKNKIFPIHPSFKYSIIAYRKNKNLNTDFSLISNLVETEDIDKTEPCKVDKEFIRLVSGEYYSIPDVSNNHEIDVMKKIYQVYNKENFEELKPTFKREMDMTNDKSEFISEKNISFNSEDIYPLYEGRMVHQFDAAYKGYVNGEARKANWKMLNYSDKSIIPQFYVTTSYIKNKSLYVDATNYRAGFCDVSGQKNERTVLATIIPKKSICGNKVPTCRFKNESDELLSHILWVGIANSFVIDWLMRRKMTTTINFFHWKQVKIPLLDLSNAPGKTIVLNTVQLLSPSHEYEDLVRYVEKFYGLNPGEIRFQTESTSRAKLRSEIDIIVAQYFDLNLQDLSVILSDFESLDRGEYIISGDKKYNSVQPASYVTRDYLLYNYAKSKNIETNNINIVEMFRHISRDFSSNSNLNLQDRINIYKENSAEPYKYIRK